MLDSLVKMARSYRVFDESYILTKDFLIKLVERLRFISSARNAQPLKYIVSADINKNEEIFSTLKWAGYLKDWDGPKKGQRPSAYIVIVRDNAISKEDFSLIDTGIAIQTIMLSLAENRLGGCTIAAIDKERLRKILDMDDNTKEIICVVAIGKPIENIIITDVKDNDIKYFRDKDGNHYVPKRDINELLLKAF